MTNWREVQEMPERSTLEILREMKDWIVSEVYDAWVCSDEFECRDWLMAAANRVAGNDYAKVNACLREHGGDIDAAIRDLEAKANESI